MSANKKDAPSSTCASCDSASIVESTEEERFPFGDNGVEIFALVTVLNCQECGFSFTDSRAEQARHAAVCRQQGLLSPYEVKAIRERLGMSRRQFSEAFGIPPASMERWENGKLIQNMSLDTLLRALDNPVMAARLDRRSQEGAIVSTGNVVYPRFGRLEQSPEALSDARHRADQFKLRGRR